MRVSRVVQVLMMATVAGAGGAAAQLAVSQPTQKLLVLPFTVASADSAASIALADALRERLAQSAKRWVQVLPKAKLCEALRASGFPCDGLLDDQQARQLSRFLQVQAYVGGALEREGGALTADVRMFDVGGSGMATSFTVTDANPGTAAALADGIVARLTAAIRASEHVRDCTMERQRGQFGRARSAAQKALGIDPRSAGAHLCIATVYEAQRMPQDSIIAASRRALAGDSLNSTAWENIARAYQQMGDTAQMIDAFVQQLRGDPRNTGKRLAVAQVLRQMQDYPRAVEVIDGGLAVTPAEPQLIDLKTRICIEGALYRCALDGLMAQAQHDSTVLADTAFLKPAIGAAQQAADTGALDKLTAAAVRNFPTDVNFLKARAAALELKGMPDSAIVMYRELLRREPSDVATGLLIAKAMVDRAVWDTVAANAAKGDSVALGRLRRAFAARVDSAWTFLRPGLRAADSTERLSASVIALTAGSKLAQAAAYDRAYVWLDTLLQVVTPRVATDTAGPRHQIRVNSSFWWGLSSVLTLAQPYKEMTEAKGNTRCDQARAVFDRLARTKAALQLGRRVHPPTADQMLGFVRQYEQAKPQVQRAFRCRPALN